MMRGAARTHFGVAALGFVEACLVVAITVDALLPRSDWYAPPQLRSQPVFLIQVGGINWDKPAHLSAGLVLTLLGALALQARRGATDRSAARTALLLCMAWAGAVEIAQGFLAYRNSELLDFVACCAGGLLAVALTVTLLPRLRCLWPAWFPPPPDFPPAA